MTTTSEPSVDEIIWTQESHVWQVSRAIWTVLCVFGLIALAASVVNGHVNGLTIAILITAALAANRVIRAHDKLKTARAALWTIRNT